MQTHKKLKARILSLVLSAAMVTTMMPMNVFAAEGGTALGTSSVGTIQSFDKLEDRFTPSVGEGASSHVYSLAVKLDTPAEDLNLPDELTAMVARTVTAPVEDDPVVDSGKPSTPAEDETIPDEDEVSTDDTAADDTISGNQPASPSDVKEEEKEEIKDEDVPLAPEPEDKETTVTTVENESIPVEWKSDKEYKSDVNGKFIYTAVLPEGYTLADGVKLPQIYVSVGRQARAAQTGSGWSFDNGALTVTTNAGTTAWRDSVDDVTSVTSVIIDESITEIGTLAFANCSFDSVTLPAGLTTIDENAFNGCASLTEVTIPANVTNIGAKAFFNCTSLATVTMKATTPPALGGDPNGTPQPPFWNMADECKIIVPVGCGDTYKSANIWSFYAENDMLEEASNPLAHDISKAALTMEAAPGGTTGCKDGCSESNQHVVTGAGSYNISASSGTHYVMLNNVNIESQTAFQVNSNTTVYLNLKNGTTNTLTSIWYSGITLKSNATLFIDGNTGILNAIGDDIMYSAGIGGNEGGNITIRGGVINATGGDCGAGIGGASERKSNGYAAGNITISGGTVTAIGKNSGAGIGGSGGTQGRGGAGGTINISGGIINATGGANGGAGIGGGAGNGNGGDGGNITISNGTVTATGGSLGGVGIGGGAAGGVASPGGKGGSITINGGTVTAIGGTGAACSVGIGAGTKGSGQADTTDSGILSSTTVTVSGGTVITTGKSKAVNTGTLTLTGTAAKHKVGGAYTGATNFNSNILYEGTTQTTEAKDVKLMPTGTQAGNVSSTPISKTSTQVVLAAVTPPDGEAIEYAYSTSTTAPDTGWQDSTTFTGLTANTTYYFFARIKANDKHYEGAASTGTAIATEANNSTITPTTAAFDKYAGATGYADVAITQTLKGNTLTAIKNGSTTLTSGTSYTVSGNTVTIKKEYLAQQAVGTTTLTFDYSAGTDPTLAITVSDSTPGSADKTTLINAIADANNLKGTVIVSDSSASSVTSGTKFVTTAEMKALTDAITAAQTVANNPAATQSEVAAAVTALNNAVNTFNAAIKTDTYSGGSSGGGGGGGSSSDGGSTPITKPTEPVTGNSNTNATVDDKGNATVNVTDKNIADAVQAAKDAANKKGVTAGEVTAVINVTAPANSNPNTVTVNLPKTVQDQIISNKIGNVAIVIDKPDISIGMTLATITEMNKQAKADIQLSATRTDATKLSNEAKNAIGNRPAFDLKATYASGSKSITNFGTGTVSVAIPYTLQKSEVAGGLYAVYVDGNGKVTHLTNSSYDAENKVLRFSTNHFSVYGIGYKAPVGLTDIANHWAKTDIEFVVGRGLMTGTSNTTFSPDGSMTRAMFVTALGRLAGVDTNSYKTSKFTDVKADAYYAPYVNWAASKGITNGTTVTTFSPDNTVTRQEMAVFMSNYAKAMGYTVPETRSAVTFADNGSIGSWAATAVKQMQMAGVLNGKNGNKFDPTGTATRAEVAAVLHRYVELVIDRTTTEGWTTNDSGSGMYYQNGKALTGSRVLSGTTYVFNNYGETTRKTNTAGATTTALATDRKRYITHKIVKGDTLWNLAQKHGTTVNAIMALNSIVDRNRVPIGTEIKIPQK